MSRLPSEQNLPDNVTNKDIEKHFRYGPEAVEHCDYCDDSYETGEMYDKHGKLYCERCYDMINKEEED